jgi:hypothetical protein
LRGAILVRDGVVSSFGVMYKTLDVLIAHDYIVYDLYLRTPEQQAAARAQIEACYDQLAAIPRADWPQMASKAQKLLSQIQDIERQRRHKVYWVTEAARQLVAETEGHRDQDAS